MLVKTLWFNSVLINRSSFLNQLSEIVIVDVNTSGSRISSGYTMTWKETAFYVFIVSLMNISWLQNRTKNLHTYQQDFEIGRGLLGALKNMSKANAKHKCNCCSIIQNNYSKMWRSKRDDQWWNCKQERKRVPIFNDGHCFRLLVVLKPGYVQQRKVNVLILWPF